jgi:hypothetical protein
MGFKRKKIFRKLRVAFAFKIKEYSHLNIERLTPSFVVVFDELHQAHIAHLVQSDQGDHIV